MKFVVLIIGLTSMLSLASACSDSGGVTGKDNGKDPGNTNSADGEGGEDSHGGSDDHDTFEECAAVSQTAGNNYQPVDVIFAIDNSPSMGDEIDEVRANMYAFSKAVSEKGLDMRVVLISCLPGDCGMSHFLGICIDPPFGAGVGCPADDSNPPQYLHISKRVPSVKALRWIIDSYSEYQGMMREGAARHVVVISDDRDEWTSTQFDTAFRGLESGFEDYLFHGIFSFMSKEEACAVSHPCCQYAAPGGEGVAYRELVELTGGVSGDLCEQDFSPVFGALADSVIGHAKLSCSWDIPQPPEGETLDPTKVNVRLTTQGGDTRYIGHVSGVSDCASVEHGWFYDNPSNPKTVLVCPQTCAWIRTLKQATMDVLFGCETEIAAPI